MHWKFWMPLLAIPVIYLVVAFALTLIKPEVNGAQSLNFERLTDTDNTTLAPDLRTFTARDGATLSYAHYPSETDLVLILLHGSGYHGSYLAPLAHTLSETDAADIYVPNIRGHFGSGPTRGDVNHMGQLEEDLEDLIERIRTNKPEARIVIGGHSSGGALALRYASGAGSEVVNGYIGLAPFLGPDAPVMPDEDSGWAHISLPRIIGLSMLNTVGIDALDHLETIRFNMPHAYRDGSETLSYSWRLMRNFALHRDYAADLAGIPDPALILIGTKDEALKAEAFPALFEGTGSQVELMDDIDHFGIVLDERAINVLSTWLSDQ